MKRHLTESTLYEDLTLNLKDGPKIIAEYQRLLNQKQVEIKGKASVYSLINSVFMEVTPSPFTEIFMTDTTEDDICYNVEVCYELVDDPHSGVGPPFRVYVVATMNIEPLQPLST